MPSEAPAGPAVLAALARGVGHRFGGKTALAGVDLALRRGEITALVGANGSGKTTLLRILAGILQPTAGEVEVLGIGQPARSRHRRALFRRTSYVSQSPALDPEMTGGEILLLAAALYGIPRRSRRRQMDELAAVTRGTDAILVVDAVSSLGIADLRMDEWGVDVVVAGSQKGLMLPPGLSFCALSEKAWGHVKASRLPKYYFDIATERKFVARNECRFTPAVSIFVGLREVLKMIETETLPGVVAMFDRWMPSWAIWKFW